MKALPVRARQVQAVLERIAATGIALWMLVLGALPLFHLIGHRDDHTHQGGAIVWAAASPALAHGHQAWLQAGAALLSGIALAAVVLVLFRRRFAARSSTAALGARS